MSTCTATVRAARRPDLAAVAGIYRHYVLHSLATFDETPRSSAEWEAKLDELTSRGLPFLVAEEAGRIVGFAYAGPWRPKPAYRHTVEDTVYLDPGATGRGIGGALLGRLMDACARAGVRRVIAVVADAGGEASVALHRRFGFTDAGRLSAVGYKHGRWIDTVLLERALADAPSD
ncbi:GNAT family N-acetyltransferase [Streptomyces tropicalis]|uniref:GNAT family N-acetyltransferase n=1 Tax=Streptomyces tropicalis TaxID=3034234 RepID=A0ABT6A2Y2_9ACTN|nr:GNAT family N-acetyltransferase [Streptomyces tropicalis]MDF3298160.1 GNAT family N-acetyltransferase [Streptomyces tropicalis]